MKMQHRLADSLSAIFFNSHNFLEKFSNVTK